MNGQNVDGRPIRVDFAQERGSGECCGRRITRRHSVRYVLSGRLNAAHSLNQSECMLIKLKYFYGFKYVS